MNSPQGSSPGTDRTELIPGLDGQQNGSRKRKRKTFSCDQCRRRKLRCDRTLPACARCQKAGNAAGCVYESIPEPLPNASTPSKAGPVAEATFNRPFNVSTSYASPALRQQYYPSNLQSKHIAALEGRIDPNITSSNNIGQQRTFGSASTPITAFGAEPAEFNSRTSFYGKGFKTGFFGPSSERGGAAYTQSLLKLYPELKIYLLDNSLQSPAFSQLRTDAMRIRKNAKLAKKLLPFPPVVTLFDVVPDEEKVTRAVEHYWDAIESTYRILHGPSFWTSYRKYWANTSERTESFAATILLILSIVNCLNQPQPRKYRALSSVGREEAVHWIEACEDWMDRQSRKHLTIESFQHKILLCIAKQMNCVKIKQAWERTQGLLSFAVATGLHQNAAKLDETYLRDHPGTVLPRSRTTCYEREMRKRLWATIVELELQASFDKGVLSSRFALLADCGQPSLIMDENFDDMSTTLPAPEARETWIPATYLHYSYDSVRLRASLVELINTSQANYDATLEYDDQIHQAIGRLPEWTKSSPDNVTLNPYPTAAALLEIQLQQFLILLHLPFATRTENISRYNFSRIACIDAGDRILQLHGMTASSSGTSALSILREDAFRATMAICYNAIILRGVKQDLSTHASTSLYITRADAGLSLLEEKVLCLGEYYAQMWYASSALGMLKSVITSPSHQAASTHVMAAVAERLTAQFAKVVMSQEEMTNEQTAAGALTALAAPQSAFEGANGNGPGAAPAGMGLNDLGTTTTTSQQQAFFDGPGVSAWGFDEMWPFSNTGLSW